MALEKMKAGKAGPSSIAGKEKVKHKVKEKVKDKMAGAKHSKMPMSKVKAKKAGNPY